MPVSMLADTKVTDYDAGPVVSEVNSCRTARRVETDYLIVGAGALGMTFADQLLTVLRGSSSATSPPRLGSPISAATNATAVTTRRGAS